MMSPDLENHMPPQAQHAIDEASKK